MIDLAPTASCAAMLKLAVEDLEVFYFKPFDAAYRSRVSNFSSCIGFSDAIHDGHVRALRRSASEKRQWTRSRMGCRGGSAGAMGICRFADGQPRVGTCRIRGHRCEKAGVVARFC